MMKGVGNPRLFLAILGVLCYNITKKGGWHYKKITCFLPYHCDVLHGVCRMRSRYDIFFDV